MSEHTGSEHTELEQSIRAALSKVIDPELRKPITELNMVKRISVADGGAVHVEIYLTTEACPKKSEITSWKENFCGLRRR